MRSLWSALDRVVAPTIDTVFHERIELFPLKAGKADTSRTKQVIEAVPRAVADEKTFDASGGQDRAWLSRMAASSIEVDIDRLRYPTLRVEEGDRVRLLDWPGQPFWEVANINDRISNRLILALAEV